MSKDTYYITTPLYYVNAKPHIGHAYTNVLCDTFARYHRFLGEKVFFLTGTDEHGTKIEKIAKENEKSAADYVEEIVPLFKTMWETLGMDYDYFIRTTDEDHKKTVEQVLLMLTEKGDIYQKVYSGWYCTPCESFWTELQLQEGKCPDCQREVQQIEETNYFFKLAQYQDWLIQQIKSDELSVKPVSRKNEILGFLKQPLEDLCITRPKERLEWGIPFAPDPNFVVYVWFDALINYVSALGYKRDEAQFEKCWPADVHVVGKDILRQHAVYWPIMLKACGVEMPRLVLAHGWWTMAGAKVSKSRGNSVDPHELVEKYNRDTFRYYMLREVTLGFDGAFSEDLLVERYTTDLANDLGNLWSRSASMVVKYFEGKVPEWQRDYNEVDVVKQSWQLYSEVSDAMAGYDPRTSLEKIWSVVSRCNQYIEEQKPWALAKDDAQRPELAKTMAVLMDALAHVATILQSFLPDTSSQILARLSLTDKQVISSADVFAQSFVAQGTVVDRGEPLFPKLEDVEG